MERCPEINERSLFRHDMKTYFVELQANETGRQSGSGSDSGNDLSSNLLGLVSVGKGDAVVGSSEVGGSGDEINVEVAVVVLLEVDRGQAVSSERGWRREGGSDGRSVRLVCKTEYVSEQRKQSSKRKIGQTVFFVVYGLGIVHLNFYTLLRHKLGNLDRRKNLLEESRVGLSLEAIVERMEVGTRDDVIQVDRLRK